MKNNTQGRVLPEKIEGYGVVRPYGLNPAQKQEMKRKELPVSSRKVLSSLEEAFRRSEIRDGMTVSFHHHLRDGDLVVNMALNVLAGLGIKDLILAPSALFPVHEDILRHVRSGTVRSIQGSVNGPVGRAASEGLFDIPIILRSHGGRVRAMETGELVVDVAVLAAPTADSMGNVNGIHGPSACGSLGYAFADARYAKHVIAACIAAQATARSQSLQFGRGHFLEQGQGRKIARDVELLDVHGLAWVGA